jgi:hypothetical protein
MHRDTRHEVGSQLAGYELTGARYELTGVRAGGIVNRLLRGQLRELLCDQVVILRESLQLVLRLLEEHRGIDLLRIRLRLLPRPYGLADPVCDGPVCHAVESAYPGRVLKRRGLRCQLGRQKLQQRLLQSGLLRQMLPG